MMVSIIEPRFMSQPVPLAWFGEAEPGGLVLQYEPSEPLEEAET